MEGYLFKWQNMIVRWKKLYFILHEDILIYCDKKGGQKLGSIHLKVAAITQVSNDPLRININTGTIEIQLKTLSSADKNLWYANMRHAKEQCFGDKHNFDYDDILEKTKKMSINVTNIFRSSNINALDQVLAEVWQSQARLDEILSILVPKLDQNSKEMMKLTEEIEKIGAQLKENVTKSTYFIQEEWKHLNMAFDILAEQSQTMQKESDSYRKSPSRDFQESNLFNHNFQEVSQRKYYNENDTEYESFDCDENDYHQRMDLSLSQSLENGVRRQRKTSSFISNNSKQEIKGMIKRFVENEAFNKITIGDDKNRTILPAPINENEQVSFYQILKDSIGKDLSKISFPVKLNEPLSMLQKQAESMHYYEILDKADQEKDSCLRMGHVMGFVASFFSTQINRTKKPFNPLLHETYELTSPKFKFIAEQVSHHPPISATYCYNDHFEYQTNSHAKTSFWGRSMEVKPLSSTFITLKKHNDKIKYKLCQTSINNIVFGTMYVDHHGEINFENKTTGDTGQMVLSEKKWNGKGQYEINGWVKDKNGQQTYKIQGKWNESLTAIEKNTKQETLLWQKDSIHQQNPSYYNFSNYSLNLNHINKRLLDELAPTDARFRPDQRALECGEEKLAADEKHRLEQKQRAVRKENEAKGVIPQPFWFREIKQGDAMNDIYLKDKNLHAPQDQDEKVFMYTNEYFGNKDFSKCPDLY